MISTAFGQNVPWMSLPNVPEKTSYILNHRTNFKSDSTRMIHEVQQIRDYAIQVQDQQLLAVAHLCLALGYADFYEDVNPQTDLHFKQALMLAQKQSDSRLEISILAFQGYHYYSLRRMKEAMPLFLQARACLNTMDWKDIQAPEKTFQYLSFYFGTIGETQLSIDFLEFAKDAALPKSNQLPIILDNLGLQYLQLKDTTHAISMFKQAEAISFELKDYARLGRVLGNMAEIHKKRGEIDLAIALIKQDIEYAKSYQDDMNYMYANVALADLYLIKKDYQSVQAILDEIEKMAIAKKHFLDYQLRINQLKLQIATANGDDENELLIRRKISAITDSIERYNGDNTIKDMKWAAKIDSLENNKDRQQLFSFNPYTASFLLLAGVAACFYLIQIRKVRKIAIRQEEDRRAENILLSSTPIAPDPIIDKYQFLTENHLMTEEAWHDFKLNFSHKYPHFLRNIVREFPELTETNLRYITLEKLGFKPQEIAGILGITLDAIKKAKQRLKKKLAHRYRQLEEYPLNS